MKNIIFLLGTPRSGTTLLQRMLSSHPDVKSIAEPWILLPLLTSFDSLSNISTYSHQTMEAALDDLCLEYPAFESDYNSHINTFVMHLYEKMTNGEKYFLDKTPRYYLIAEKLRLVFKDAKFIYLFRSPVDVIDSTIKTFCSERLYRLPYYYFDLTEGMNLLSSSLNSSSDNQIIVLYERLCKSPESELDPIFDFLDLECDSSIFNRFSNVRFKGDFGDPNRKKHQEINFQSSQRPLSWARKRLYLNILSQINNDTLSCASLERVDLENDVNSRRRAGLIEQLVDLLDFAAFRIIMFVGLPFVYKFMRKKRFRKDMFLS